MTSSYKQYTPDEINELLSNMVDREWCEIDIDNVATIEPGLQEASFHIYNCEREANALFRKERTLRQVRLGVLDSTEDIAIYADFPPESHEAPWMFLDACLYCGEYSDDDNDASLGGKLWIAENALVAKARAFAEQNFNIGLEKVAATRMEEAAAIMKELQGCRLTYPPLQHNLCILNQKVASLQAVSE